MKALRFAILLLVAHCSLLTGGAQTFIVNSFIVGTPDPVPTLTTATLTASTTLVLGFSEPVSFGAGGNGGFAATLSGGAATLTYSSGADTAELTYTVSRPVAYTETGTLAYTQPGNGVEDSNASDLASFSGFTITNSIPSFTAATALFDGVNDYIGISSGPTGLADGKAFTVAFWFKPGSGTDGSQYRFVTSGSSRWYIERTTSNTIRVFGQSSGGTTAIDVSSTSTVTEAMGWTHIKVCYDCATAGTTNLRKIYINGVSDTLSVTTFANVTIDASNTLFRVGASSSAGNKLNGALAELWIDDTYLDDPTKFASGGHPISLGTNGQTPTGSAPAMYYSLNGSANSWATDSSGNGNTLTVTGSLESTTAP